MSQSPQPAEVVTLAGGGEALAQAVAQKSSWLLRLFQSDFFNASMAVTYLYQYQDDAIQAYLCAELFKLPNPDVEFYLPQLVNLYIMRPQSSKSIEELLLARCALSPHFALQTAWLLDGHIMDGQSLSRHARCLKLRNRVLGSSFQLEIGDQSQSQPTMKLGMSSSMPSDVVTQPITPDTLGMTTGPEVARRHSVLDVDLTHVHLTASASQPHLSEPSSSSAGAVPNGSLEENEDLRVSVSSTIVPMDELGSTSADLEGDFWLPPSPARASKFPTSGSTIGRPFLPVKAVAALRASSHRRAHSEATALMFSMRPSVEDVSPFSVPPPGLANTNRFSLPIFEDGTETSNHLVPSYWNEASRSSGKFGTSPALQDLASSFENTIYQEETMIMHEFTDANATDSPANRHHKLLAGCRNFLQALSDIGSRLTMLRDASVRKTQLYAELVLLNLSLPARVYLPLYESGADHFIVRIPPMDAVTLNSKAHVPCLIHVEAVACEDFVHSPVPPRIHETSASIQSSTRDATSAVSSNPLQHQHHRGGSPCFNIESSSPSTLSNRSSVDISGESGEELGLMQSPPALPHVSGSASLQMSAQARLPSPTKSKSLSVSSSAGPVLDLDVDDDDVNADGSPVQYIAAVEIRKRLSEISLTSKSSIPNFIPAADDPSALLFREPWDEKVARVAKSSPYSHLPGWKLLSCILKVGDDLRQEHLAAQFVAQFQQIFKMERLAHWLSPVRILVTSNSSGLMQTLPNAMSMHSIKKNTQCTGLRQYFLREYGEPNSERFMAAQRNFVESLAGYSLVCYFLQLKDRHNGNILLDQDGHLIHIDFGFFLSSSPRNLGFESAPFKLTPEFVDVMGGKESDMFKYFKILMLQGFVAARKHSDKIVILAEIMQLGSRLPCFIAGEETINQLRSRFHMSLTEDQLMVLVETMVDSSMQSLRTKLYDNFQYYTNGIL